MSGRKQKPKHRNRLRVSLMPNKEDVQHNNALSTEAPASASQNRQTNRAAKAHQNKRVNWTFIIAVISTVAATISGAIAYQSYKQANEQPDLGLHVYKTENGTEY